MLQGIDKDHKYIKIAKSRHSLDYDIHAIIDDLHRMELGTGTYEAIIAKIVYEAMQCGYSMGIDQATTEKNLFGFTNRELAKNTLSKEN